MPSPARPRHIAYSAKQKKEYLQLKRAMKRGEIDADETLLPKSNGRTKIDKTSTSRSEAVHDALELRSKFTSVPRDYVERTRVAAWDDELERPLLDLATVFPLELVDNPAGKDLTVPSRPAFHAGQSKREVEDAEEEEFRKWRYATREIVDSWTNGTEENENDTSSASTLRSPSRFEINIEVWRQL
jgi:hypothetical protein